MGNYDELFKEYKRVLVEYETYQNFAEGNMQILSKKISSLEKNLDVMSSIIEISKYINSNITGDSLLAKMNDMVIGIMGVNYSTIYLKDEEEFIVKASNITNSNSRDYNGIVYEQMKSGEPFIVNSKEELFNSKDGIHSVLGAPIYLRNEYRGYVIIEQSMYGFFNDEHINFVSAITNQIAIAIENSMLYEAVKQSAIRDPLLGIFNRKHFFDIIEHEAVNSNKYAIVMVDIDNFKKVNDTFGHQFGDEVLIQTASILHKGLGSKGILARYGGEELVAYISDAGNCKNVYKEVDEIRKKIEMNTVKKYDEESSVTISLGIAYSLNAGEDINKVIMRAGEALYRAKALGKNRVIEFTSIGSGL